MTYPVIAMMIDGAWIPEGGAGARDVLNPASGARLGEAPLADAPQLDAALEAAARAFPKWRSMIPRERARILKAGADRVRERVAELAVVMSLEQGKPLAEASSELHASADMFEWFAEEGRRGYGRLVPGPSNVRQMVTLEPVGPAVAFTPWNFPALTPARKIGAALAAGCTLVLKAAEETPATAMALVQALMDGGLPAGVLNLVFGDPAFVSERLIRAEQTRKVSFTGSAAVGRQLLRLASDGLKRTTMELGGHAPVIVFDDVDPAQAAKVLAAGKFRNAGQVCISPTRFFVQSAAYDAFVDGFLDAANRLVVGEGTRRNVTMGPLTHARRPQAMEAFVDDALRRGGQVRTGGRRRGNAGYFFDPTVVTDLPDNALLMTEEPFGPIAPITRFTHLDEVLERANALPMGLASYAFTTDNARAMAVADGLRAGMVGVNTLSVSTPETPFGGVRESGHGQEGGSEGLSAYLDVKFIAHAATL
jgi:succinate-semialdehyde dehydrogenase/glutarate-semialdehyde dehydrogenase